MLKQQMENKMAKEKYTNKSSVTLHGVAPGADFDIDVDANGTPKNIEWRKRIRDSKIDGCIEKKEIKTTKKKNTKEA